MKNRRETLCLQNLLSITEFPVNIKVKRVSNNDCLPHALPQKEVLQICNNIRIERIKCITKGSEWVHLPVNLPKPVMYTSVEENIDNVFATPADIKKHMRKQKLVWLVVTNQFVTNARTYEIGEILEVIKPSLLKRLYRLLSRKKRKKGLTVVSHPTKEKDILAYGLRGDFKKCTSPYKSCYRLIADLIEHETTPFLITVPVNPATGVVLNDGKVTTTKHNKRLLVLGKETYHAITTIHEDETVEDYIIPSSMKTEIEVIENKNTRQLSDSELKAREELLLSRFDSIINRYNAKDDPSHDNLTDKVLSSATSEASNVTFQVNRKTVTTSTEQSNDSQPKLLSLKRISSSTQIIDDISPTPETSKKKRTLRGSTSVQRSESTVGLIQEESLPITTTKFSALPELPIEAEDYLVPVTGFTTDTSRSNSTGFTTDTSQSNSTRLTVNNPTKPKEMLDTENVVEVGLDGYVLVSKKKVVEVAPMKREDNKDYEEVNPKNVIEPNDVPNKPKPLPRSRPTTPKPAPRPKSRKSQTSPIPPPRPIKNPYEIKSHV